MPYTTHGSKKDFDDNTRGEAAEAPTMGTPEDHDGSQTEVSDHATDPHAVARPFDDGENSSDHATDPHADDENSDDTARSHHRQMEHLGIVIPQPVIDKPNHIASNISNRSLRHRAKTEDIGVVGRFVPPDTMRTPTPVAL